MYQRPYKKNDWQKNQLKSLPRFAFSILIILVVSLISSSVVLPAEVNLQAETPESDRSATADELVYFTNLARTQFGLPALSVNSTLMATAQQTAETMAGIQMSSHIGGVSDRIQQAGYGGGVNVWATENIANGTNIPAEELIYVIWNDDLHNIPMMNPIYCDIGAGVATDSEGTSYFVVHAAYTEKRYCGEYIAPDGTTLETLYANNEPSADTALTAEAGVLSQWMQPVSRVTPNGDGQIIHTVDYGQTLWSIAITYGTKIKEIQALNGYATDNLTVYVGQILLIPTSLTPYPTEQKTATPAPRVSTTPTSASTLHVTATIVITNSPETSNPKNNSENSSFSTIIFWIVVGGLLMILFGILQRFMPSE
ncbi:MAG: LysM peptidoglycan-binding domain-containing protein [Anaerolineaceae bacterium]|nr:LysM peptidoglycan-binding domain-containing protein [Anaerolineaceae bacterium]